ncbi:MAG: hypothetical protein ABSE52_10290 [Candidatus Dormibacteria bacterium]|jgi:hypothetical protein
MRRRTLAGLVAIALALVAVLAFFTLRGWPGATPQLDGARPQLDGLTPMRGDLLCGAVAYDSDANPSFSQRSDGGALIGVGYLGPSVADQGEIANDEQCFAAAAAECDAAAFEGGDFAVDFGRTELVEVEPGAHCSIDYRWTPTGPEFSNDYHYGKCANAVYTSAAGLSFTGCDDGYIAISSLLPPSPAPGSSYPPATSS